VKDMVMDQRARPSDRTKTPEEIAQEEKEQLEKLEVPLYGFDIRFNPYCFHISKKIPIAFIFKASHFLP
jgi:hypothetical protein